MRLKCLLSANKTPLCGRSQKQSADPEFLSLCPLPHSLPPSLAPQSSLSVGSDLDLTDTPTPAFPLRRSWDANQEGAGLEVLEDFFLFFFFSLQYLEWPLRKHHHVASVVPVLPVSWSVL